VVPSYRRAQLASQVRRARCSLSEASAQLLDVGLDDVLLQLTNIECDLEDVYLKLMEPTRQRLAPPGAPRVRNSAEQLPF
jgi:hypothetical protein